MQKYPFTITKENTTTKALEAYSGVSITIYTDAAWTVLATIYSDDGVTVIPGSTITTDSFGMAAFYAADGDYWYKVTSGGDTIEQDGPIQLLDLHDATPRLGTVSRVEKLVVAQDGASGVPTLANGEAWFKGETMHMGGVSPIMKPHYDATNPAYGADPTGVADSTTALQNCLNAAAVAGAPIVYAPKGIYKYSRFTIPEGVTLIGDGSLKTIFQTTQVLSTAGADNHYTTSSIACTTVGSSDAERIRIQGIKFERHSSVPATSHVAYIQVANMVFSEFVDLEFGVGGSTGISFGFYLGDGSIALNPAHLCEFSGCKMVTAATGYANATGDYLFYQDDSGDWSFGLDFIRNKAWGMDNPFRLGSYSKCCRIFRNHIKWYREGVHDNGQNNVVFANHMTGGYTTGSGIKTSANTDHTRAIANLYDGIAETYWVTGNKLYLGQAIDGGQGASSHVTKMQKLMFSTTAGAFGVYGSNLYLRDAPTYNLVLGGPGSPSILTGSADPSVAGVAADLGSLYLRSGALTGRTPRAYIKYGAVATNWLRTPLDYIDNAGTPVGAVTPDYIGQVCRDTSAAPDDVFFAVGLANTDWEKITP